MDTRPHEILAAMREEASGLIHLLDNGHKDTPEGLEVIRTLALASIAESLTKLTASDANGDAALRVVKTKEF